MKLTEEKALRQVEIKADLLNPGDTLKTSFLASLTSDTAEPRVVVRAAGVKAIDQSARKSGLFSKDRQGDTLILLAPALTAVLSTFLLLSRSRLARKLGLPSVGGSLDQSELGAYVCSACHLNEEADSLRFGGSEISFRGIADFLRYRARQAPDGKRHDYAVALQALILNSAISSNSFKTIVLAIGEIQGREFTDNDFNRIQALAIDEGSNPARWRQIVDEFVHSNRGS